MTVDRTALLSARPTAEIGRLRLRAIVLAVLGGAAVVYGLVASPRDTFFQSYLIGFIFWMGITVGSLAVLMVQYLSGGAWGLLARRVLEASTRNLPLMGILFIPIALNLPALYSWARPAAATDVVIQAKAAYLNQNFFIIRAIGYFVIWMGLAFTLNRWSRHQDEEAPRLPGPMDARMRVLSGPGLVLYMITITFMSVDWIMSLEPHFTSAIFGILTVGGQGLSTMAFTIIVLHLLSKARPVADVANDTVFHDLGKLMLAFVMLWAYFNISQLLIIWSANLPEEIPWYITRLNGPWRPIAWTVLLGHFCVPFLILLSRDLKRNSRMLAGVAVFILAMRVVDVTWTIAPIFRPNGPLISWLDIASVLGIGGLWLTMFWTNLAGRALVPANDPYFKEAVANVGH